jgi:hypothetical protein
MPGAEDHDSVQEVVHERSLTVRVVSESSSQISKHWIFSQNMIKILSETVPLRRL